MKNCLKSKYTHTQNIRHAAAEEVTEILPIQGLLSELYIKSIPTNIYKDKTGAIELDNKSKFVKTLNVLMQLLILYKTMPKKIN